MGETARETPILRAVMLQLSRLGSRVFRNNVGICEYGGARVRYGLCPGSSDIIGWTPVTITPAMVGRTVAVFTAIETKTPNHRTKRERLAAQLNFIDAVRRAGGIAAIVRCEDDAGRAIREYVANERAEL